MDRLELVRQAVDDIVRQQPDPEERRCGFVHLYGVSATSVLLAMARGLDPQLCAIAGMLHDIWSYKTGDPTDHARLSAQEAKRILAELGCFTQDEIAIVCEAISRHSAKDKVDGEMAELLKDADVFQHCLYNPALIEKWHAHPPARSWAARLNSVLEACSISRNYSEDHSSTESHRELAEKHRESIE
jgi:uncharacterized protein